MLWKFHPLALKKQFVPLIPFHSVSFQVYKTCIEFFHVNGAHGQEWDTDKLHIYTILHVVWTLSGQVYWRIMGPNNPLQILEATNDISMVSGNKEVTTGSLLWNDGESGEKSFVLDLKPFSSWEVEKTFLVEIYNVQGSPSEAGSGEISISAGKTTIIVWNHAIPYFMYDYRYMSCWTNLPQKIADWKILWIFKWIFFAIWNKYVALLAILMVLILTSCYNLILVWNT